MVNAYHLVFGTYGFWLPNDPRGSWSVYVGSRKLYEIGGPATKTDERRSVAKRPHDRAKRLAAKEALMYPPVHFTDEQIRTAAFGFGRYVRKNGVRVWAAAVMPDHVHMVIGRHTYEIEKVMELLKQNGTTALVDVGVHPMRAYPQKSGRFPKCWTRGGWSVFLTEEEEITRAIRYVEQNPIRDGLESQSWPFVTPFEGF